jgi:hypothetical protein
MTEFFTARRFNQDTAAAKRAAEDGPVYVTDRGRPSHVLMSFEEYTRLAASGAGAGAGAGDLLSAVGSDVEAAAIDLDIERARDLPRDVSRDLSRDLDG